MHRFPDQHFPSSVCPRLELVHPLDTCGDLTAAKTSSRHTSIAETGKGAPQDHVFRCQYETKSSTGLTFRSVEPGVPFICAVKQERIGIKQRKKLLQALKQFSEKSFYGGCLSYETYPSGNCTGIMFQPKQLDLKGLVIVPVLSPSTGAGDKQDIFSTQSPFVEYPLSEPLLQIETSHSTDKGSIIAALRTPTNCHLMNITGKNGKPKLCHSHTVSCNQKPSSISLSPFIKGEYLISSANGSIQLMDIDKKVQHTTPEWEDTGQTCWSHFGSHPRLLLAHQRRQLDLFDIRSSMSSSTRTCLMKLPNEMLARDQEIQVIKHHPVNNFYHLVATQDMLVLLDERFPKYNVLQWCHRLQSPPCCINMVNQALPTDDLAIVSSYSSRQSHCLQFSCLDGSTPMSTSPIWKLSTMSSWLDAISHRPVCHGIEDIKSWLSRPLIGTCSAWHTDGRRLAVFQLSEAGDIFQQTLSSSPDVTNDENDKYGLSEKSEKICRQWLNRAILDGKKKTVKRRRREWSTERVPRIATLQELKEIDPHPDCKICFNKAPSETCVPKTPKLQDNVTCSACGTAVNHTELSNYIKADRTSANFNTVVLTSKVAPSTHRREEQLPWKPVKYSQHKDAIGCLLRKHWTFDGDDDKEEDVEECDQSFADDDNQAPRKMIQIPDVSTAALATSSNTSQSSTKPKLADSSVLLSSFSFQEHMTAGQPKVSLTLLKKLPKSRTYSSSPMVPQKLINFLEAKRQPSQSQSSIVSTPRSPQKRITARRKLLNRNFTMGF